MISAIYSTPLSFLTSVIWTISSTTMISTWLPLSRKTLPVVFLWSPSFEGCEKWIFHRNLRTNQISTLPRELSDLDSKYYSREQKEKDDALVKLHKDFTLVLLHTALQTLQEPDLDVYRSSLGKLVYLGWNNLGYVRSWLSRLM